MVSQEHESGLRYLTEHNMNKCNTTILKKNALDIAQLRHHDLDRTIIHTPHGYHLARRTIAPCLSSMPRKSRRVGRHVE